MQDDNVELLFKNISLGETGGLQLQLIKIYSIRKQFHISNYTNRGHIMGDLVQ